MAGINYDTASTGYGGNYGGAGYGGYGYSGLGGVGLFGLFGLRGIDDNRCNDGCGNKCAEKMIDMHDHHDDHNHTVDEIHDVEREVCASERLMGEYAMMLQKCCCDTDKDILEAKYDLGTQILNAKFENALQGKDIIREIDLQSCGINRNVDEVKFNQALFAKDAQAQLAECCCNLENKIRDSIDATNKAACEGRELALKIDAKNDAKDAERERRELQREIDELRFDKRLREGQNEQNILNNFGTITDSLNKVITALGNTSAAS